MKANRVVPVALAIVGVGACVPATLPPAPTSQRAPRVPPRSTAVPAPVPTTTIPAPGATTPAPPHTSPPRPVPPSPAPAADWRDAPQTPGTWRWSNATGRSTASYAAPGQSPVAMLWCDTAQRATILWTNAGLAEPAPLVVTTTGTRRLLTAQPQPGGGGSARLASSDPLLDAMAFSRGRFMLEMAGSPALYLPAWPELSRVIEDCR